MALQKSITSTRFEATFPNSYARILNMVISKKRPSENGGGYNVIIDVAVFAAAPQNENTQDIEFFRYVLNLNDLPSGVGANPINRGYEYLKTLPEWSDALDV